MKVKSESEVTQSCPTLSNPMDCSLPGSSVHGISQARVLDGGGVGASLVVQWLRLGLPMQGVSMELEQTGKGLVWWRREEKGRLAG